MKPEFGWPLMRRWLEAIVAHPVAYAIHRVAHANRFFQFLCSDCKEPVFTGWQSTNQKEFTFDATWIFHVIDTGAQALNNSPLGPPYVWLLICLAWAWAGLSIPNRTSRTIVVSLALSGAMYALGFVVIGIAHEYRYIYWTLICALITTPVIAARVFFRSDAPAAYRVYPLVVVTAVIVFRELVVRFAL
jgi:hypothetical protein